MKSLILPVIIAMVATLSSNPSVVYKKKEFGQWTKRIITKFSWRNLMEIVGNLRKFHRSL